MDFTKIEEKWQKKWEQTKLYKFNKDNIDKKHYLLEMFSYPSGVSLHLGHWYNFGLSDSYGRFKRLQGYEVFEPMGFDAFGLPAENYALKTGIHPEDSTLHNIDVMEQQLRRMGGIFDWDYEIITCNKEYYKWTQWLFTKLFEKGLAYQKFAAVNFCPHCNTVLANEQVVDGHCERCENEIERKNMTQWFLKITEYAEQLLEGLDKLDWPEKTKITQRNWIGKSKGAEVDFKTLDGEIISVFTSRVDTLYGVSYLVLAPEHSLVPSLTTTEQSGKVNAYIEQARKKDDITRTNTTSEKTGVFTGSYAINPINGKKVPIFIGDYVLATYATGAVMGVAAHDTRDFDFAKKYDIPIIRVIEDKNGKETILPYTELGILVNSDEFNGLTSQDAKTKIVEKLETLNAGRSKINYKLRDWSVSRQRYWGCPIPIIYCPEHGAVPVPEKELPVIIPHITDYKPDGHGPLGKVEEYMNTTCPLCGKASRRDPDTLDTYVCSTWYQFRFPSANYHEAIFDKELTNKMLPVDTYVGGVENATSHLIYSRFITKFLHEEGYLDFDEPFKRLIHQGMLCGSDGRKMSKRNSSKSADDYIKEYGSDALRLYMMFAFKYTDGGIWDENGIKHMAKFMVRVERIVLKWYQDNGTGNSYTDKEAELTYVLNKTIKEVAESYEEFSFNTAIAKLMELVNAMYKYDSVEDKNQELIRLAARDLVIMLAPSVPHFSEELWEEMGEDYSVHNEKWPEYDESKLVRSQVEIVVQINSKIITRINISENNTETEVMELAKNAPKVKEMLEGKRVVKEIYIKNRLVNLIIV